MISVFVSSGPGCFRTINTISAWYSDVAMNGLWGSGHVVVDGVVEIDLQKALHSRPTDIPDGAALAESAKLWMIRIPVKPMSFETPLLQQRDAINEAVQAALKLRQWLVGYASRFERGSAALH